MLLLFLTGVSDYAIIEATINIPVGAMTNDEYCTSIQLSSDGDIEPREETFTLSLAPLPGTFNPVNLADTVKTVTIIDGDSEFPYFDESSHDYVVPHFHSQSLLLNQNRVLYIKGLYIFCLLK